MIHTVCHKLRNGMTSAADAEVRGLFINGQDAVPSPTANADQNRQLNRFRKRKQHPQASQIPCNGHALLLDSRLSQVKPIHHLLVTRHLQTWRLIHQASPSISSTPHLRLLPCPENQLQVSMHPVIIPVYCEGVLIPVLPATHQRALDAHHFAHTSARQPLTRTLD
jgi:hypothetical protein